MNKKEYILGIDTSNYKTSVAVVDRTGEIAIDLRILLDVKQGERGLRQSDALFQHLKNLPVLLEKAMLCTREGQICSVAASDKPRPVRDSYMPVFMAGAGFAQAVAAALDVPYYRFSHQEGHIEAIKRYSSFNNLDHFLCYHLSGGTCELLKIGSDIEIIGGTKDISFGQLVDRVGVAMGMSFPAGEEMDRLAMATDKPSLGLKEIPLDGLYMNLSGIETRCSRMAESSDSELIRELFDKIVNVLIRLTIRAAKEHNLQHILFTGGVSSSNYISRQIKNYFSGTDIHIDFGSQELAQDNAVGIALLGGNTLWP